MKKKKHNTLQRKIETTNYEENGNYKLQRKRKQKLQTTKKTKITKTESTKKNRNYEEK